MRSDDKCRVSARAAAVHDPYDPSPVQPPAHCSLPWNCSARIFKWKKTLSLTVSVSSVEWVRPGLETALAWRCANGDWVYSPTHSSPRAVKEHHSPTLMMVTSVPTHHNTCCSSICRSQSPAFPIHPTNYSSIYKFIYSLIHLSIFKKKVAGKVLGCVRAVASCRRVDVVSVKPFKPLLQNSLSVCCSLYCLNWKSDTLN